MHLRAYGEPGSVSLIIFWQPIPDLLWNVPQELWHDALWTLFAAGWIILLLGARSFGILDLLGIEQMRGWCRDDWPRPPRLKTGLLYRWLRHPMYVGVLMGVWVTPLMSVGHALLASGLTCYVLIAMRYEERDLARQYGAAYSRWRVAAPEIVCACSR
jgi:methanethiol S-methyltransferase